MSRLCMYIDYTWLGGGGGRNSLDNILGCVTSSRLYLIGGMGLAYSSVMYLRAGRGPKRPATFPCASMLLLR